MGADRSARPDRATAGGPDVPDSNRASRRTLRTRRRFAAIAAALLAWPAGAELLDDASFEIGRDKQSAIMALGGAPVRCIEVPGASSELCEWRLGDRDLMWEELARAIETSARVGLVCRFDRETGVRERDGCEAFALRSNRNHFLERRRVGKRGLAQRGESERVRKARAAAAATITAARTLGEVVRVVGELPEMCFDDGGEKLCRWRTNARTPGHGSLAAWIEANPRKRIRLTCRFPSDGSASASIPCSAEVGS